MTTANVWAGLTQVHSVVVFVSDQERALGFYVDKLGFEPCGEEPAFGARGAVVGLPLGQTRLVLVEPSLTAMGANRASWARERIGDPTGVVLETADLAAAYKELRGRGVHFVDPGAGPGGAMIIHDADGNQFALVEAEERRARE